VQGIAGVQQSLRGTRMLGARAAAIVLWVLLIVPWNASALTGRGPVPLWPFSTMCAIAQLSAQLTIDMELMASDVLMALITL
jgi:hypothetical protein